MLCSAAESRTENSGVELISTDPGFNESKSPFSVKNETFTLIADVSAASSAELIGSPVVLAAWLAATVRASSTRAMSESNEVETAKPPMATETKEIIVAVAIDSRV
jgi:hypothetical protein